MSPEQARALGQHIRTRRLALGMTTKDLAERCEVARATIVRLEQGAFAEPRPEKLSAVAEALGLSLADVYALADYAVPADLPSFQPYLRTKYRGLPREAIDDINKAFERIARKHGYQPDGPVNGEDEEP